MRWKSMNGRLFGDLDPFKSVPWDQSANVLPKVVTLGKHDVSHSGLSEHLLCLVKEFLPSLQRLVHLVGVNGIGSA